MHRHLTHVISDVQLFGMKPHRNEWAMVWLQSGLNPQLMAERGVQQRAERHFLGAAQDIGVHDVAIVQVTAST